MSTTEEEKPLSPMEIAKEEAGVEIRKLTAVAKTELQAIRNKYNDRIAELRKEADDLEDLAKEEARAIEKRLRDDASAIVKKLYPVKEGQIFTSKHGRGRYVATETVVDLHTSSEEYLDRRRGWHGESIRVPIGPGILRICAKKLAKAGHMWGKDIWFRDWGGTLEGLTVEGDY